MAFLRYAVPALAVASQVAAQLGSADSCSAATTTIQNQGDASALAACRTFTGSIAIATGTTDNIALDGIEEISGSLIANNATQVAQISANSLETIGDSFTLESLTILTTLNFPRLTMVDTIEWTALPALQGLSFTSGVQQVTNMHIENTQLNSLDGIDLQTAEMVLVTNNPYLNSVNMQLGNVTQSLTLGANGRQLDAEFPNLEWAYNMSLLNCSSVSIPSLASINGSLGFYSNSFGNLSAPNLTTVGGTLSFVSNSQLTNISMPELTTIGGGFQVANNSDLDSIDGFPVLATVGGALDFNGGFENVTLPDIKDVRGAFQLLSTENITAACTSFKSLSGQNNVIKGTFTCKGKTATSTGNGTSTSGGSSSGSGSSSESSSPANPLLIPGATGLLGVVAAVFGML